MARHNNTSRSLQIMSKLQGWDPSKIDGVDYAGNSYPEDRTTKGEQFQGPLPKDPQGSCADPAPARADNRNPGQSKRTVGDPYGRGNFEG